MMDAHDSQLNHTEIDIGLPDGVRLDSSDLKIFDTAADDDGIGRITIRVPNVLDTMPDRYARVGWSLAHPSDLPRLG